MAKFIRISHQSLSVLWMVAQHKRLMFESPNKVLRAMVIPEQPKPRKDSVLIRVEDEVWTEIEKIVARQAVDTRQQVRNKDNLMEMLFDEECKKWLAEGRGGLSGGPPTKRPTKRR